MGEHMRIIFPLLLVLICSVAGKTDTGIMKWHTDGRKPLVNVYSAQDSRRPLIGVHICIEPSMKPVLPHLDRRLRFRHP